MNSNSYAALTKRSSVGQEQENDFHSPQVPRKLEITSGKPSRPATSTTTSLWRRNSKSFRLIERSNPYSFNYSNINLPFCTYYFSINLRTNSVFQPGFMVICTTPYSINPGGRSFSWLPFCGSAHIWSSPLCIISVFELPCP